MNDLTATTLTGSVTTDNISSFIQSVTDKCTGICNPVVLPHHDPYNPVVVPYYDPYNNFVITTTAYPVKLETDSNELKINIKKHLIKFNFSL